jgi:hypothetical protein
MDCVNEMLSSSIWLVKSKLWYLLKEVVYKTVCDLVLSKDMCVAN